LIDLRILGLLSGQNKAVAGRQHMTVWSRLEDKARITAQKAASRRASPPLNRDKIHAEGRTQSLPLPVLTEHDADDGFGILNVAKAQRRSEKGEE